ncbi:MAG: BON domain-containing protein [Gemmatimonadota bacterium]
MKRKKQNLSNTAVKFGIFGAVALGAVVSGFLATRQGRRFVKDVWDGRKRTPLEDRALDAIWADKTLGRRRIDVHEIEPGVLALEGHIRDAEERRRARALVARLGGVTEIEDRLEVAARM